MKLMEHYIETWEERYKIYILWRGGTVIILDEKYNNKFIAALSSIEEARDFIAGWPKKDCEGNTWKMVEGKVIKDD